MHEVLERLAEIRLVPVVTVDDVESSEPLAQALLTGGLPCVEVTLRTESALDVLERMAGLDLILGAGTVLSAEQAEAAVSRGARFLASPGFDADVVDAARRLGVPMLAGVATASEIQSARRTGLDVVKLFPAEGLGGVPMLRALAAPFPELRFVPTGGIDGGNLRSWLAHEQVAFCGGSWLAPRDLLREGNFAGVRERVEQAVKLLR